MKWTEQRHPGERLVEWGAPAVLATASGWAAYAISGSVVPATCATAAVFVVAAWAMDRAGRAERGLGLSNFAVEPIDAAMIDELLLDDPLCEISPDSRVVSLFAPEATTPGALVTRIADYLGERSPQARPEEDEIHGPVAGDAGAALHAALANIRASLR
jgi:hypothetical protein